MVSGGCCCCVGELYDLEDRPEETLSAIVTLGFTHSVVEGVLDIRGVRGQIGGEQVGVINKWV